MRMTSRQRCCCLPVPVGGGVAMFCCLVVVSVCFLQAVDGGSADDDATKNRCVPECVRDVLTQYRQRQVHDDFGINLSDPITSRFPGGNQCWDCQIGAIISKAMADSGGGRQRRRRQAYNFTAFPDRRWPLPVQYFFDASLPLVVSPGGVDPRAVIRDALSHIAAQTCVRFTEIANVASTTNSYISFELGSIGCVAFVGRTLDTLNSPIFATNDCLSQFGEMLYLVVTNLGMWHTSQRPDRNAFVRVVPDNVLPGYEADLTRLDESLQLLQTFGLPYDFASLMHFPGKIFSWNGSDTIQTIDPLYQHTIGQRVQLSFLDTKLINLLYCPDSCSGSPLSSPCTNGGYQNPNNCSQCHCPDGFGGTSCTELAPAHGAVCGGTLTALSTEQTIVSPGYTTPGFYEPQVSCTWRIQSPVGRQIRLRFVGDFGLYCKNSACYHWVEVRYTEPMNNTGPRFCCSVLPSVELLTTSNEALVIFQSNLSGIAQSSRRGFQLAFAIVDTTTKAADAVSATTTTTTTSRPQVPVDPCSSNPCHNNGICNVTASNPSGYVCACPAGLMGPLCQQGYCGGCSAQPGQPVPRCVANEVPVRMCNVTRHSGAGSSHRGGRYRRGFFGLWGFPDDDRRHASRTEVVQVPCTFTFCCENAKSVGIKDFNEACAVEGWTDWTPCPFSCGGSFSVRTQYAVQQKTVGSQTFSLSVIVNRTSSVCNSQACSCPPRTRDRGRWSPADLWSLWCSPCKFGFQLENSTCVPTF